MQVIKQKIIDLNTAVITYKSRISIGIGETSDLLPIELLGASIGQRNLGFVNGPELEGNVNTILLLGISASCESADWDLKILNMNDATKVNTIYEVLFYESIEYSFSDFTFSNFFIDNNDSPQVPYLYAQITNNGAVPTGLISLNLIYKPIY